MRQAFFPSLLVTAFLAVSILVACGSGGGSSLSIPTPPPTIVVALTNSASAIDTSQSDSLTATVQNDPNNKGVKWTITCPPGVTVCGGMAQATSASGAADMYNAPSSVSAAETLTVTATSVSDPTKFVSVQVRVNPPLTIVSTPPPQTGNVGQPFSLDLTRYVQGGTLPDTWSIKSGTLPAGLTLNPIGGIVSGIPTTVTSAMHGRVQVSRSGAATAIIVVFASADSGNPPVSVNVSVSFTINPAPPLTISPVSGALPNGFVGTQYGSLYCSAVSRDRSVCTAFETGVLIYPGGGVQPYSWSRSAAFAPGLTLPPGGTNICKRSFVFPYDFLCRSAGVISGTPTTVGTYSFVVTLTDSESPPMQASANYTITIATPSP